MLEEENQASSPLLKCSSCSHFNVEQAKCCGECGNRLLQIREVKASTLGSVEHPIVSYFPVDSVCNACAHINPDNAKFCGECSEPLTKVSTLVQVFPGLSLSPPLGPVVSFHRTSASSDGLRAQSFFSDSSSTISYRRDVDTIAVDESEYFEAIQSLKEIFRHIQSVVTSSELAALSRTVNWLGNLSSKFQLNLAEKLKRWNNQTTLGDLFLSLSPLLTTRAAFATEYEKALVVIEGLESSSEKFEAISSQGGKATGRSLRTLLQCVASHIFAYDSMVQKLLESVPVEHPDFKTLSEALKILRG